MGKRKKLLIVALIVISNIAIYGATELEKYEGSTTTINNGNDYINKIEQTVNTGKWLHITNGTVTNEGTVIGELQGGTAIFQLAGKVIEDGEGGTKTTAEFINATNGKIIVNGGKGFYITVGKIENSGEIKVTAGIGIDMTNNNADAAVFKNETGGKIEVTGGTGISLTKGSFNNLGTIEAKSERKATPSVITAIQTNGAVTFNNQGTIKADGLDVRGITIKGTGQIENSNTIEVLSGGIGAYFDIASSNFINNEGASIIVKEMTEKEGTTTKTSSRGIFLNKSGKAKNKGKIAVGGTATGEAGAIGVQVNNADANFTNESKGTIEATGTNSQGIQLNIGKATNEGNIQATEGALGVYVNGELGSFINNSVGTIEAIGTNSKGIQVNAGEAINDGYIEVTEGASGVYVNEGEGKKGSFTNNSTGVITASGANSKGIFFGSGGGTAENNGTISVTEKGIGVYFGETGTFVKAGKFTNKDKIQVLGTESKGIYLNLEGTAENEGTIIVGGTAAEEAGAIGVQVNNANAKFTNSSSEEKGIFVIGTNSKGIQVNAGEAINNGYIQATEGASGIYVHGVSGKFTNNSTGTITTSGANSKGIFFGSNGGTAENSGTIEVSDGASGVFFYQGDNNNFINNSDGKINVNGEKSVGLLLNAKGTAENKGTIKVNSGKGVVLGGSTFINTGTIDAGEDGIAIESSKDTNNTLILKSENTSRNITSGSSIIGKIVGSTGIDVLVLDNASYSGLNISGYENISVIRGNNSNISDSVISLGYNSGTESYLSSSNITSSGALSIDNSSVVIDLANQAAGIPLVSADNLVLAGDMKLAFTSTNGQKEFNLKDMLGGITLDVNNANFGDTAVWEYKIDSDGNLQVTKNDYSKVMTKSQLRNFADVLDNEQYTASGDFQKGVALLSTLNAGEFTGALTQLSGGIHGYIPDLTVINSRTLTGVMKNRTLSRDTTRNRPVSSYDQDIAYINNHHKLSGLMDVKYDENGILGITEKQILSNGRIGLVYGGSKGKVKFDGGTNGKADMDNLYIGGYYNHEFSDKLVLMSNMNFVYSHNNVTRYLKFGDLDYTFDSTYPSFGFGAGTTLFYTVYDKDGNKAVLYGGINWEKVIQGNINEEPDRRDSKDDKNLTVKNVPANEQWYDSVVPSIGVSLQHNGYILDRKYRLGADIGYETELGNIKDGKRLKLSALNKVHSVETTTRENILSYSLYGELDMTENLSIFADYTKSKSKEYDADKVGAGFKYKMDRMSDVFVMGPILSGIENTRLHSNRWSGVMGLMMEAEDDTNRPYYDEAGKLSSGDYATSLKLKPKFTLSLNDRQTKWSYYFEGYYLGNSLGKDRRVNERKQYDTRLHGEARWTDQYSKGRYGFTIGYRNETSSKPNLSQYVIATRSKRGTHEFRFAPNFTYNLGNGFVFGGSTTGIVTYDYRGVRKGEMDFEMENQYGITYNGFMPRMRLTVNYFREEFWRDHGYKKPARKNLGNGQYVFDLIEGDRRYQSNQLRPSMTYFFGNGGRLQLDARIPLGNGAWYKADGDGKKAAETYETRYGIKYFQPITPGLTGFIGTEILTMKVKNKNHASSDYGKETRTYSIRPNVGFSYNF
ncbi:hypothetical protein [Fusobacterium sp.]|uniref:hypothetical protein n=1 Tax=Fusobacterium sp. TaxID=68766 RepID=UPI0028FF26A1|nr:hypothetical protein [Fusobacterium sp.]MDU1910918.1 hypothetical protein [Fusobacterium sp.]